MVKKHTMFFETPLRVRFEQDPILKHVLAMQFAVQLPLRVLGFPGRTSREEPAPGDYLEKFFDGCSGESNALMRVRERAARMEARLSLVTKDDVGVAVQFFKQGGKHPFAEFVTSFSLVSPCGQYHGVGLNESGDAGTHEEVVMSALMKRREKIRMAVAAWERQCINKRVRSQIDSFLAKYPQELRYDISQLLETVGD